MRWEDERYVRLYTRDTVDWHFLSFEAQGLMALLMRKVDRAGILELGKHGKRGVASAIGHPSRIEIITEALEQLLADGCVIIKETTLLIPNFVAAQEAKSSDKARQQKARELARDLLAAGIEIVTPRDEASHGVTDGHAALQNVTRGHTVSHAVTPSRTVLSRTEPKEEVADEKSSSAATSVHPKETEAPIPIHSKKKSTQETFFAWAQERRRKRIDGVEDDQAWSAGRINSELSFVKESNPDIMTLAYDLFLEDEHYLEQEPACPMWMFAQDHGKLISRAHKESEDEQRV